MLKHVSLMTERGFEITREQRHRMQGIPHDKLASRWQDVTEDDLVTGTAILQAQLHERSELRGNNTRV